MIRFIVLFFAGLIAFPKLLIYDYPILISDLLVLVFWLYVLFHTRTLKTRVLSFFVITFFCITTSSLLNTLNFVFYYSDFLLGIKRFAYILTAIYMSRLFYDRYSEDEFIRVLKSFVIIGLIPLCFSLMEILLFLFFDFKLSQVNLVGYDLNSYNTSLLPVGFTGRATDFKDLFLIGSSSINYGILNCLLGTLSFIYYVKCRNQRYRVFSIMYFIVAMMSRSSSVFIILFTTMFFMFWRYRKFRMTLFFSIPLFLLMVGLDNFYILLDVLSTVNSVMGASNGDFDSWDLRVVTFNRAFEALAHNPSLLIWGSGYGSSMAMALRSSDPLVESFVLETLLGVGIFSFVAILVLIIGVNLRVRTPRNVLLLDVQNVFQFLFPFMFILNLLSGNIFGNEYLGFLFFFISGYFTKFV